jgi:hypothetical protein
MPMQYKPRVHPPNALRLCEATGRVGWLQRYCAPGQRLPTYLLIKARAYGGDFPTAVIGNARCVDVADIPEMLQAFDLIPIGEVVAKETAA